MPLWLVVLACILALVAWLWTGNIWFKMALDSLGQPITNRLDSAMIMFLIFLGILGPFGWLIAFVFWLAFRNKFREYPYSDFDNPKKN
jgi:hypothetical protein